MRIIAIYIIRFYRVFISPLLPDSCRFEPTCSEYSIEAFRVHGFFKGSYLTVRRILRCNPFCKCGYDPVPQPEDRPEKQNYIFQKLNKF